MEGLLYEAPLVRFGVLSLGGRSSVGRALRSQRRGRRFESARLHREGIYRLTCAAETVGDQRWSMADVLVLGGGLCGALAGMILARDGHDVTVLERDPQRPPETVEEAVAAWAR